MLLEKYQDVMSDIPGRTGIVEMTIDVGDSRPISQCPYKPPEYKLCCSSFSAIFFTACLSSAFIVSTLSVNSSLIYFPHANATCFFHTE